jgi:hypothetical protein
MRRRKESEIKGRQMVEYISFLLYRLFKLQLCTQILTHSLLPSEHAYLLLLSKAK